MSKFDELYEHLKECVDSDSASFIGVTEQGVEFNVFEWAFGLAVQARREVQHNQSVVDELRSICDDLIGESYENEEGFGTSVVETADLDKLSCFLSKLNGDEQ